MRTLFLLWLVPVAAFSVWHLLTIGGLLDSGFHDELFRFYGSILGVEPHLLPGMLMRAFLVDGAVLLAILAFRRRRMLADRLRTMIPARRESSGL